MRLFLAAAVLMLAFVAHTEAQEETVAQRFSQLGEQLSEMGRTVAEKATTVLDSVRNSDVGVKSSALLQEYYERFKAKIAKFGENTQ